MSFSFPVTAVWDSNLFNVIINLEEYGFASSPSDAEHDILTLLHSFTALHSIAVTSHRLAPHSLVEVSCDLKADLVFYRWVLDSELYSFVSDFMRWSCLVSSLLIHLWSLSYSLVTFHSFLVMVTSSLSWRTRHSCRTNCVLSFTIFKMSSVRIRVTRIAESSGVFISHINEYRPTRGNFMHISLHTTHRDDSFALDTSFLDSRVLFAASESKDTLSLRQERLSHSVLLQSHTDCTKIFSTSTMEK